MNQLVRVPLARNARGLAIAVVVALGVTACESGQQQLASPTNARPPSASPAAAGTHGSSLAANPSSTVASAPGPAGSLDLSAPDDAASSIPKARTDDQSGTGATNAMADPSATTGLSDGQIAAMVASFNEAAIQQAQLAEARAFSPAVKRFAQHMISAHRTMESRDAIVLSRSKIVPTENAVSNRLRIDAQDQLSALQSIHGRDFDRQYIDGQVRDHNKALELLVQLTAIAQSPDLRTDLRAAQSQVEDHLQMAKKVLEELEIAAP